MRKMVPIRQQHWLGLPCWINATCVFFVLLPMAMQPKFSRGVFAVLSVCLSVSSSVLSELVTIRCNSQLRLTAAVVGLAQVVPRLPCVHPSSLFICALAVGWMLNEHRPQIWCINTKHMQEDASPAAAAAEQTSPRREEATKRGRSTLQGV